MNSSLITALQNPALYDYPIRAFTVIETHISWVLLTGKFAYKIKKPVNFGFLDFSSLQKRHDYCQAELRLNQRLAPQLYNEVIPIRGSHESPQLQGDTPIIEYAIKMREFNQEQLFSHLLKKNQLLPIHIIELAKIIAAFHQSAARIPTSLPFGTPQQICEPVYQNFDQITALLTDKEECAQVERIRAWTEAQYKTLYSTFIARREQGYVRECHGDIHLGNIILHSTEQPILFDCIEFNEAFRWTDVMADTGFIVMDLQNHQRYAYAHLLLNMYLEKTGDYAGLAVLPYYQSYRAIVRAKLARFRLNEPDVAREKRAAIHQQYQRCMALAESYLTPPKLVLIITQGLSGSGKSGIARRIVEHLGCIQIRSDVERKRLHGITSDAQTHSGLNTHLYDPSITEKTYTHLLNLAGMILDANYPVIVDATFLKESQRAQFKILAARYHIPFIILHCHAPLDTLKTVIQKRLEKDQHTSEATLDVLYMQQTILEPFSEKEQGHVISLDSSQGRDAYHEAVDDIKRTLKYYPYNAEAL